MVAPAPGGPAEAAGVQAGDIIVKIGDTPAKGLPQFEAASLLQGGEGTKLNLTVQTPGAQPREVPLIRQKVTQIPVFSEVCSVCSKGSGCT